MSRKYILSGLGILTAFLLCVGYIFVVVLQTPITRSAPSIKVDMVRTGGLFEGSEATYRGVRVGKVTAIDLTEDGVQATVKLTSDVKIPKDSVAQVRSLSPVGEQYIDFKPKSSSAPYLADGDRIPAETVDLPQTIGNLSITLNKLITQVDPDKVKLVLDELSTGLAGSERDLRTIVQQGGKLIRDLDENFGTTQRVLTNGRALLLVGAASSDDLIRASRNAKVFAAWLRVFDPTLMATLKRAPGQLKEMRQLVADAADVLPAYLQSSVSLTGLLAARDPHLRELLTRFPQGVSSLSNAIHDGSVNLDLISKRPHDCDYPTDERSARDVSFRALQDEGHCSTGGPYQQRGAQYAPGPVR